ncbi:MAG: GMP/IMP nucleotidase [Geobacter sp.]|nr:GMP/IMP nucleotidase [Geobacter sp.]
MLINWTDIDTVLLDMDGTLLDRHFDDHFWLEHVPKSYSEKCHVPLTDAKEKLYALFRSQECTLNWTDLDYWSEQLGLDIPMLKREVDHLIAVHPGVIEFITFLSQHGKQIWLVTNAHGKTLELKMGKTRLGPYFTGIVSAHDLGLPKEDVRFWQALQGKIPYDPARTMLGEDSEVNLGTAREYGIKYLIHVSRSSSALSPNPSEEFTSIHFFTQLMPVEGTLEVQI